MVAGARDSRLEADCSHTFSQRSTARPRIVDDTHWLPV